MTKNERVLIGKQISNIIQVYKTEWKELKEQISSQGYQSQYSTQYDFEHPIKKLINSLSDDDKQALINEWKSRKERIQFESDEIYLKQYEAYIMEEIVSRASKASYYM